MSKVGVSLKIDVSKIDKNRLFKGAKGVYLDATVFIDLDQLDQYGNSGMITQDVSKEEKQQQVKGAILGNCKLFWSENGQSPQAQNQAPVPQQNQSWGNAPAGHQGAQQAPAPQYKEPSQDFDSEIPF
jgi:hypothetical protein